MAACFSHILRPLLLCFLLAAPAHGNGGAGRAFHFVNKCKQEIWVGTLGSSVLNGGGWVVAPGLTVTVSAPSGWHGRFWGRTGCRFDSSGKGKCETGDCGGLAKCSGLGGQPPATLAEFSLGPPLDFYDVSLVDGYNLRMSVEPRGGGAGRAGAKDGGIAGSGELKAGDGVGTATHPVSCNLAGCIADVNALCPTALRVGGARGSVVACRSACNAFSQPQYCCTGAYSQPSTCRSTFFSRLFKRACPHAYTYAYDDPTSIFTCSASHSYLISFCS